VENCSRPDERILRLQLNQLKRGLAQCQGPVLVMIGEALAARGADKYCQEVVSSPQ